MGEWTDAYGSKATTRKIFIGKGIKYFPKAKVGEFFLETQSLKRGDKILITGPTTGVIETTVDEIRVDDKKVAEVNKGEYFSIRIDETIRASDKLYKVVDA
jgi:putative protease